MTHLEEALHILKEINSTIAIVALLGDTGRGSSDNFGQDTWLTIRLFGVPLTLKISTDRNMSALQTIFTFVNLSSLMRTWNLQLRITHFLL